MLDDETAMRIHDATLIMRNVTPELYQVFMLRYVSNLSQGDVGAGNESECTNDKILSLRRASISKTTSNAK